MRRRWDLSWWPWPMWRFYIAKPRGKGRPFMTETSIGPLRLRVWANPKSAHPRPFRVVRVH